MYLLELIFENSAYNGDGCFRFRKGQNSRTIAKWTTVENNRAGRELLKLITIGLGGDKHINAVTLLSGLSRDPHRSLKVVHVLARHYPQDIQTLSIPLVGSGVEVDTSGHVTALRSKDLALVPSHIPARKLGIGKRLSAYFLLAYGPGFRAGPKGEDFHFRDPLFRRTRFHSLLMPDAPLTHPADFLARLRYKGIRRSRIPSKQVLSALCTHLSRWLNIRTDNWSNVAIDPDEAWNMLRPWQQRAALPVLDMARHMMDAFPRCANPLDMPGVVLMDRPETFCTRWRFEDYLMLLDSLFPRIQFVVYMGGAFTSRLPESLWKKRLSFREEKQPDRKSGPVRLSRHTVLLIDADGRLPNLALMKLCTHYRRKGHPVFLGRRDCFVQGPDRVYASTLFYSPRSEKRNQALRRYYGNRLNLGGTGEDISSRLPDTVEALQPDYALYPELSDRAIGFVTRAAHLPVPSAWYPKKREKPGR